MIPVGLPVRILDLEASSLNPCCLPQASHQIIGLDKISPCGIAERVLLAQALACRRGFPSGEQPEAGTDEV